MLRSMTVSACVVVGVWSAAIQYPRESRLLYTKTIATSIISSAPPGARLIGTRGDLPPLIERLIHNATKIRYNIVDTFRCDGKVYGYYADQDNDCQIFHICVPMQQLFPDLYDAEDIYQFSFICPAYTIFTQDAMVCAWVDYAFPCAEAHHLYDRNNNFFVVPAEEVYRDATTSTPVPALTTQPASSAPPVSAVPSKSLRLAMSSTHKPKTHFLTTISLPSTPLTFTLPSTTLEPTAPPPTSLPLTAPPSTETVPPTTPPSTETVPPTTPPSSSLPLETLPPETPQPTILLP